MKSLLDQAEGSRWMNHGPAAKLRDIREACDSVFLRPLVKPRTSRLCVTKAH